MKNGRLSKKEKDFLDQNLKADINSLCNTLNRSREQVVEYVREQIKKKREEKKKNKLNNIVKPSRKENTTKTINIQSSQSRAGELLARNEKLGVVVMTEASSSESDKHKRKPKLPSRYNGMIHKIKGE